jgi:hypothetical protein
MERQTTQKEIAENNNRGVTSLKVPQEETTL